MEKERVSLELIQQIEREFREKWNPRVSEVKEELEKLASPRDWGLYALNRHLVSPWGDILWAGDFHDTAVLIADGCELLEDPQVDAPKPEPELPTDAFGNVLDGTELEGVEEAAEVLVNLTPHPISFCDDSDKIYLTVESSGVARVASKITPAGRFGGVRLSVTEFGRVEGLPESEAGVIYIVSALVLTACPGRLDLYRPDTGPDCLRDDKGRILAVRRLTR